MSLTDMRPALALLLLLLAGCRSAEELRLERSAREVYAVDFSSVKDWLARAPLARAFDYPLCKDGARGCYDAQPFGVSEHLGEDWNRAGNNKDLGSPVYAIADGIVVFSADVGNGWGKVLRIVHRLPPEAEYAFVESLYAHFTEMLPRAGDIIRRGAKIGTLGTAGGIYEAHLHLELRSVVGMPIGGGYSSDQTGYLEAKKFIAARRP